MFGGSRPISPIPVHQPWPATNPANRVLLAVTRIRPTGVRKPSTATTIRPTVKAAKNNRRLLRLFPSHYRCEWEEELLAVLLAAASPAQRQVHLGETCALLW